MKLDSTRQLSRDLRRMPMRKAHHKSRRGCLTCKKRRVKCDESGPPCGTCAARETPCEYASLRPRFHPSNPAGEPVDRDARATDGHRLERNDAAVKLAPEGSDRSQSTRLEIELMHRWSTSTYRSFCRKIASDREACQIMIPLLAMHHECLLHSLFSVSALEIAACKTTPADRVDGYVQAAMDYHGRALRGFRDALACIDSASQEALLFCSSMLMVFSLASSRHSGWNGGRRSIIEQVLTHVQLIRGMGAVLETDMDLANRSVLLQNFPDLEDLQETVLSPSTTEAFERLTRWNESRLEQASSFESRLKTMSNKVACQKAIFWLRECFTRCIDADIHGYILALPGMIGPDFVDAIRARDAVALVILVFWGVLFERASTEFWWAQQIGTLLLEEVTERLREEKDQRLEDALDWARKQILCARERP